MNRLAHWRRGALALLAFGLMVVLTGCVVSSKSALVPVDEAVELLPANLDFVTYKEDEPGKFTRSDDQPGGLSLVPATRTYVDAAGEITAYFVPRDDGTYLISVLSKGSSGEGVMYGVARYKDGILELRMIFSGKPDEEMAAAGAAIPDGATIEGGGIVVTSRAGLETIIHMVATGALATTPLIAWAEEAPAPDAIVGDGDWYRVE
ncbi:MAG: hypothetical protein J0I99_15540 [Devosia sp.]|uniref:hypothetical protein n=1 Tax=Devosia sp. TaxID=1871048 RepID=UPI001AD56113|nr:hypothetical protein [Devosia sp.]MBN9317156.1 hypothetical protein [Devosia sp.]